MDVCWAIPRPAGNESLLPVAGVFDHVRRNMMIIAGRRLLVAGEFDGALLVDIDGSSPLLIGLG
jgi:hypothetical protein